MTTKYSNRLKKAVAAFLALAMVLSSLTVGLHGRDFGRDITYVYVGIHDDMQIPDAYQFSHSIYLRRLVGNIIIDGEVHNVSRTHNMFIHPQTGWIYVVEIEMDGIIVLDENHNIVPCPRTGMNIIRHFTTTGEFIDELFATIYPDYEVDEYGEFILNENGVPFLTTDGVLTQPAIDARRAAFIQVRCDTCENCILYNFRIIAELGRPTTAPPLEGEYEEEYEEEEYEYEEYEEEYYEYPAYDEDGEVWIPPMIRLRNEVTDLVNSRGYASIEIWHYANWEDDLPCEGDYYFITGIRLSRKH